MSQHRHCVAAAAMFFPNDATGELEMRDYVTLRDMRDEDGSRYLSARLKADGTLLIEGQDVGPGVERYFGPGNTEYEWAWLIGPEGVSTLKLALACDQDVLAALEKQFSGEAAAELKPFLDSNDVPYEPWSRVGD